MKIVFYLGHHKTGSTSLQQFLAQNSTRLLRNGILYPFVESRGMSYQIQKALKGEDKPAELSIPVREAHSALAQKMLSENVPNWGCPVYYRHLPVSDQLLRMIQSQVDFMQPDALLLVSEVFSNFSDKAPGQIRRLAEAFGAADERQIYICLRRPDEYLVAWHKQRLKFGSQLRPLRTDGLKPYFSTIHFDYAMCLEGWINTMPRAELCVRRYSDTRANGGSIGDFMAQTGLNFPEDMIPEKSMNRSIPHAMLEIVRLSNAALPPAQAKSFRQALLKLSGDLEGLPSNNEVEMFGAENRELMMEQFAPVHEKLSEMTGESPFFPDLPEMALLRPVPEIEAVNGVLSQLNEPLVQRHFDQQGVAFLMELKKRGVQD